MQGNNEIQDKLINQKNIIEKNYFIIPIIERSTKNSIDDYKEEEINAKKKINSKINKIMKIAKFINNSSNYWFKNIIKNNKQ
jgi:hypothetical protein